MAAQINVFKLMLTQKTSTHNPLHPIPYGGLFGNTH